VNAEEAFLTVNKAGKLLTAKLRTEKASERSLCKRFLHVKISDRSAYPE
jgi:hypothetical protein